MINIFDSHAHYDDKAFNNDRYDLLDSLFKSGISGIINAGSDLRTSRMSLDLSKKYELVYAAVGIHPHEAQKASRNFINDIRNMIKEGAVAIGEIGLDYHYDFSPREAQVKIFEDQLKLAKEMDIPVIVHDRDAHMDSMNLLKKYKPKGVVHCFSGSYEMALEVIKLGMYIGIGGALTFKNARKLVEIVSRIDMSKILLETDCPYMTPEPYRGKRNDSSYIPIIAKRIAEIKSRDPQEILNIAAENTKTLFNL